MINLTFKTFPTGGPPSRKRASYLLSSSEFETPSSEFSGVILRAFMREREIPFLVLRRLLTNFEFNRFHTVFWYINVISSLIFT